MPYQGMEHKNNNSWNEKYGNVWQLSFSITLLSMKMMQIDVITRTKYQSEPKEYCNVAVAPILIFIVCDTGRSRLLTSDANEYFGINWPRNNGKWKVI